jgi:uncharacterized protein
MDATKDRPLAVVTGASSGIGLELAKQLAAARHDLVVCAEDVMLRPVAEGLSRGGVLVEEVVADLSTDAGVDELWRRIAALGRPVDVLVLNAGVGEGGAFVADTDLDAEMQVIDLDVRGTVRLAKHVLPTMAALGRGRVMFVSSIAATQPGAFHAVHNASKAFVQSFAVAIREELRDTGVTVTALMPGPTDTAFFERAGLEDTRVGQGPKDDPAQVAEQGFKALMAGEEQVVAGSLTTKLMGRSGRFLPDGLKATLHRAQAEPGSGS